MAALEILRWILSVILYFQVHFLQSILLLDCQLCCSTGCSSTPVSCGSPLLVGPDEPYHLELSDPSLGWLFKRWSLLCKCKPLPVMLVTVPSPCLPPSRLNVNVDGYWDSKGFVCNAPYFFPCLFSSFLSFSSQCCYLWATITFLFKWHTLSDCLDRVSCSRGVAALPINFPLHPPTPPPFCLSRRKEFLTFWYCCFCCHGPCK